MTPQEQNKAIAKACGWRPQTTFLDMAGNPFPDSVPIYTTDLNAMHEAEKVLTDEQFQDYDIELTDAYVHRRSNNPIHATAAQRAEAFLRIIGKWRE